ncbi:MAG: hypothetical protein KAY37_15055, partial [Phycisphaerae bacterium]|nr:hypothetical protein [Phycisphaerae bacterium]
MSTEPELTRAIPGQTPVVVDTLPDREARNPFFRHFMHLGLPVTVSVVVHVGILVFLGLKTFEVMTRSTIAVGEYEASLTESLDDQLPDAFRWADPHLLETPMELTPEESFESLTSLREVADFTVGDLDAADLGGGAGIGDGQGLGIGDG